MEDVTQFRWRRATGRGYAWQTLTVRESMVSKAQKGVRILTFPTPTGDEVSEIIQPQKINGALLWLLSETDIDESAILEFANAFGLLTHGWMAYSPRRGERPVYRGTPFTVWKEAITEARKVIGLLTAIEGGNKRALAKAIRWDQGGVAVSIAYSDSKNEKDYELLASPDYQPETLALFEPGDLVMPARIAVSRVVNRHLAKLASPQLLWSEAEQKFGVYLVPESLLGAIWAQFAENQDQLKAIGRCEVCGTWFERVRSDKRHCSDRCRVRAMRKRKESRK